VVSQSVVGHIADPDVEGDAEFEFHDPDADAEAPVVVGTNGRSPQSGVFITQICDAVHPAGYMPLPLVFAVPQASGRFSHTRIMSQNGGLARYKEATS
jgi:hypothetical protein